MSVIEVALLLINQHQNGAFKTEVEVGKMFATPQVREQ